MWRIVILGHLELCILSLFSYCYVAFVNSSICLPYPSNYAVTPSASLLWLIMSANYYTGFIWPRWTQRAQIPPSKTLLVRIPYWDSTTNLPFLFAQVTQIGNQRVLLTSLVTCWRWVVRDDLIAWILWFPWSPGWTNNWYVEKKKQITHHHSPLFGSLFHLLPQKTLSLSSTQSFQPQPRSRIHAAAAGPAILPPNVYRECEQESVYIVVLLPPCLLSPLL